MWYRLLITFMVLMISTLGVSAQEPEEEALPLKYYEEQPMFNGGSYRLFTQWVK